MATSAGESDNSSEHSIEINGTNDMICARCYRNGEESGAVGICKECKYYLCSQCVDDHRKTEHHKSHRIAFFYCETNVRVNRLVRATSFCLDCGHYLCAKCKLNHRGFRAFRHHTFIGGKIPDILPYDHELSGRNLVSRHSRSTSSSRMSKFTLKECGRKSPYLSSLGNISTTPKTISLPEPKKHLVGVEEPAYQRARTLIKTTTGKNHANVTPDELNEINPKPKRVHYEDDHVSDTAELVGEFDQRGPSDREHCNVIASVFLGNDKLVVADERNRNIKMYDGEYRYNSTLEIAKFPVALCPTRQVNSEFFASSGSKVLLVSANKELTLKRTIETDVPMIEGLAPWESGVALIFKSIKTRNDRKGHLEVHLLTYEGKVKYEITISSQYMVKMITPLWYITTTNDGRGLLLSDTNLNRIVCIDIENWHVEYVLRGKAKGGAPRSLAMDSDGNLLVTWYGEVHKISQHGRNLGIPVKNIDNQSVIVYNQRTDNLVVHSWSKSRTDTFRVYQL